MLLREHLQINSDSSPLRVKSALNPIFLQSPPGCIFMNLQPGMAGKHVKVGVLMQHRRVWQRRQLDNQSTCEQSPPAAGNVDITQRHPQSPSPRLVLPPSVPAAAEGSADAIRPAPRPALPSAPHCRWQSRSPIVHQPGSKLGTPNFAGTLSRPKYRPELRRTAGTHRVEVALPADPSKRSSLVHRCLFGCQRPQGEVNRFALGRQLITPHYLCARLIIDVFIGA